MHDIRRVIDEVEKAYYTKAAIKQDIKLLEVKINHVFTTQIKQEEGEALLEQVCVKYQQLYDLLSGKTESGQDDFHTIVDVWKNSNYCAGGLENVEKALEKNKSALSSFQNEPQQLACIEKILANYIRIYQLTAAFEKNYYTLPILNEVDTTNKIGELKQLDFMLLPEVNSCLLGIISLFSLSNKQMINCREVLNIFLAGVDTSRFIENLPQYIAFFSHEKMVTLNTQLFLSCQDSSVLIHEETHSSKLISISNRVELLHLALSELYRAFKLIAVQHLIACSQDWLKPSTKLPKGIAIELIDSFRDEILAVIKQVNAVSSIGDQFYSNKYNDMIGSFVFWFNPKRYIDSVLAIYTQLTIEQQPMNNQQALNLLVDFFRQKYQTLSTEECINLYGYYSNKGLNYLLQTLFAITEGKDFDWMEKISHADKLVLQHVFDLCRVLMEELRQELTNRAMNTRPYSYSKSKEKISPRRRIQECIHHILTVYQAPSFSNKNLDQLFEQFER